MTKKTVPTAHALVNVPRDANQTGPAMSIAKAGKPQRAVVVSDHAKGGLPSGQPVSAQKRPPWLKK